MHEWSVDIQSAQMPRKAASGNAPSTYVVEAPTALDIVQGFTEMSGGVLDTFPPFTPGTYGVDVPFYWPALASEDTGWLQAVDDEESFDPAAETGLHWTGAIISAPADETILTFASLHSLDESVLAALADEEEAAFEAAGRYQDIETVIVDNQIGVDYSTLTCKLLNEIQRHVLEPTVDDGQTWTLWTKDEVLGFLNLRIQRFLIETGLNRTEASIAATAGISEYDLPVDLMEIRRVEFDGSVLNRIDQATADDGMPGWPSTTGVPTDYIEEPRRSLSIQLVPPPISSGTVKVLYVRLPDDSVDCLPLPLPNLFTWAIKWGVIADMLAKEGEANDPVRSEAAEGRFQEGVQLALLLLGTQN